MQYPPSCFLSTRGFIFQLINISWVSVPHLCCLFRKQKWKVRDFTVWWVRFISKQRQFQPRGTRTMKGVPAGQARGATEGREEQTDCLNGMVVELFSKRCKGSTSIHVWVCLAGRYRYTCVCVHAPGQTPGDIRHLVTIITGWQLDHLPKARSTDEKGDGRRPSSLEKGSEKEGQSDGRKPEGSWGRRELNAGRGGGLSLWGGREDPVELSC